MDSDGRPPEQPEAYPTGFRDPSAAWRWWGAALLIVSVAGVLFHMEQGLPVTSTGQGWAALAAVALGIVLIVVELVTRGR